MHHFGASIMFDSLPDLLTRKQLAAYLGIHPRTLPRWVQERKLPKPRTLSKRCVRWHKEDVRPFVAPLSV